MVDGIDDPYKESEGFETPGRYFVNAMQIAATNGAFGDLLDGYSAEAMTSVHMFLVTCPDTAEIIHKIITLRMNLQQQIEGDEDGETPHPG